MKKMLILFISLGILITQIPNTKALTAVEYEYNYNNYTSEINNLCYDDNLISLDFIENGNNINLKVDNNMRYVVVNDVYYTFEDYNKATLLQSNMIFDENKSFTVLNALENFEPINDIESFLDESNTKSAVLINDETNTISPLASYGTFYKVGEYSKKAMTISLASSAVGLVVAFITSGLGFGAASSYVTGFVAEKIAAWAVDKITADVWYKKYQAVMNSGGTTKERRYMGLKKTSSSSIEWNSKYIERTFETQKPYSLV